MNSEGKKTSATRNEDHRPIINLKHLNNFVLYKHFKMNKIEGLNSLKNPLQKGNYMCKLDQKDACFSVRLHIDSRKLVRVLWGRNLYRFSCSCFGFGPAPRIFTEVMKVPLAILRLSIHIIII